MNTLSEQETPAFQWHFLLVLLPFILGIYLADYRNLTDTAIYFFTFETILSVVFICFGRSRQWALLGLSFALGFWLQYFAQANFTTQRQFAFSNDVIGHFDPQHIEVKGALQKIKGVFSYISAGKIKQMELLCYVKNAPSVQDDYSYLLRCKPERIVNDTYPGAFDQERYYQLQNVSHRVFCNAEDLFKYKRTEKSFFLRNLAAIKATISRDFTQALSPKAAVIARALILGERDGIDQELRSYFLATGSMHILAVSGMHIGLLILALLYILGWLSFCLTRKQALLLVVGIVWYYAILTGLSASV
ncbi:MAG: hypothetical protein RIS89_1001, partial [Bacteroidota bacterium]